MTSRTVKNKTINYRTQVVKADANYNRTANNPVEYHFSNNRKFIGPYKRRGAYAPAE